MLRRRCPARVQRLPAAWPGPGWLGSPQWFTDMQPAPWWITGHVISEGRKLVRASWSTSTAAMSRRMSHPRQHPCYQHKDTPDVPPDVPPPATPPGPCQSPARPVRARRWPVPGVLIAPSELRKQT
jgi:hypothetical protein